MNKDKIKDLLEDLAKEIYKLEQLKKKTEERLIKLRANYTNLSNLYDESFDDGGVPDPKEIFGREPGITDAIRSVLQNSKGAITPLEVREGLLLLGLDLTKYSNPVAEIHKILKRLKNQEEVETFTDENGTTYKWKDKKI